MALLDPGVCIEVSRNYLALKSLQILLTTQQLLSNKPSLHARQRWWNHKVRMQILLENIRNNDRLPRLGKNLGYQRVGQWSCLWGALVFLLKNLAVCLPFHFEEIDDFESSINFFTNVNHSLLFSIDVKDFNRGANQTLDDPLPLK
jgi:hypothetical protein